MERYGSVLDNYEKGFTEVEIVIVEVLLKNVEDIEEMNTFNVVTKNIENRSNSIGTSETPSKAS